MAQPVKYRDRKEEHIMELKALINDYEKLLAEKERLASETKTNTAAIGRLKEEIANQMIEDDCPSISFGGYSYYVQEKTSYSKKSEADLAAAGVDYFGTLRAEGLGGIIVETVNSRTLQSAVAAYVEEHGELSDGLASIVREYEYTDILRRKATKKK